MQTSRMAALLAAFVGDALALGPHWVYNTRVIDKKFGTVERYFDPLTSYHAGKKAGAFTHYGDQMLLLLESLAVQGTFDAAIFAGRWQTFFKTYDGYIDQATKATLEKMSAGAEPTAAGSASVELAGAARIAPLVYTYHDDLEALVAAARRQTELTHNEPGVVAGAEFFARTTMRVLQGTAPSTAMAEVAAKTFGGTPIETLVAAGIDSRAADSREAIAAFGQDCRIDAALPATVHVIVKYEGALKNGLVANVMAGGDSAARGMLAGMVIGAHTGLASIPAEWLEEMRARARIERLAAAIDHRAG